MQFSSLSLVLSIICLLPMAGNATPSVKPIRAEINETCQKVHYVGRFANLKKVLSKPDTRYVIRYNHNLKGKIIKVGEKSTVDFQGGSFSGGTLLLNDRVVITGEPLFYYNCTPKESDTEFIGYVYNGGTCVFRSPVIIKDHSDILIENARFIMNTTNESIKWHGAIICYGEDGCKNIKISNCTFDGDKVAFYSNVYESEISRCRFTNIPFTAIAIETAYDHTPWQHPHDIMICNNYIKQNLDATVDYGNVMWCSGVENLTIKNNDITLLQGILLYCGDGNVVLKNIDVSNNRITLLADHDGSLKNMATIFLMGKSYQFISDKMPEQSVLIKGNYLKQQMLGESKAVQDGNIGISLLFAANVVIEDNTFDGFSVGVDVCDHFKGHYYYVNNIKLHDNNFQNIDRYIINLDSEPQLLEIYNNEVWNKTLNVKEENRNRLFINGNLNERVYLRNNKY